MELQCKPSSPRNGGKAGLELRFRAASTDRTFAKSGHREFFANRFSQRESKPKRLKQRAGAVTEPGAVATRAWQQLQHDVFIEA